MDTPDEVTLTLPSDAAFLPLVRVAGAVMGDRVGLSHLDIEDLRLALDELVHHVLGDETGLLTLHLLAVDDRLVVEVHRSGAGAPGAGRHLAPVIHDAVTAAVDGYELDHDGPGSFRLDKRLSLVG